MKSVTKAFAKMRAQKLIAQQVVLCGCCASKLIREAEQIVRQHGAQVDGFVYFGECKASIGDEVFLPLVFGLFDEDNQISHTVDRLGIGEIIAACLDEEGIEYRWNRVIGEPILVIPDQSLEGAPQQATIETNRYRDDVDLTPVPELPEDVFDQVGGNPVGLLNVTKVRQNRINMSTLLGTLRQPRVGSVVKLGFCVTDALSPVIAEQMGQRAQLIQLENMHVEVTSIIGEKKDRTYKGELIDDPEAIDLTKLRIGSPIEFRPDHVFPSQKQVAKHGKSTKKKTGPRKKP
jgi:hypothetical protein